MNTTFVSVLFILVTSTAFAQSGQQCIGVPTRTLSCASAYNEPDPGPIACDNGPCDLFGCNGPSEAVLTGLGGWNTEVTGSHDGNVGEGVNGVRGTTGTWICQASRPCECNWNEVTQTGTCRVSQDSESTTITLSFHYATFVSGEQCTGKPLPRWFADDSTWND